MVGKRKSADSATFSRKKRRVGKEKRPPENSTKTSFTTGKVVISTQLSLPDAEEVVTKRKQTIPVLLFQLKQHNATKRCDAIDGLREIFTHHEDQTLQHLQSLMTHTAHLYTDAEPSVRHSFQLLLKVVLSQMDSGNLRPFQQQALACMECGLTHMTPTIRVDTLKVVDLYFTLHPSLFYGNIFKFLNLHVSVLASQMCMQKVHSQPTRKMSLRTPQNPEVLQILKQLVGFLEAVVKNTFSCSKEEDHTPATLVPALSVKDGKIQTCADSQLAQSSLDTLCQFYTVDSGQPHLMVLDQYGLLPTKDNIWEESSCSSAFKSSKVGKQECTRTTSGLDLLSMEPTFVRSKLVSLLLECWIDSVPDTLQSSGNMLPHTVETFEQVAHILVLLLRAALLHQQSLSASSNSQPEESCLGSQLWQEYGSQLIKHFLRFFPHSETFLSLLARPHSSKPEMLAALLSLDIYICESMLTLVAMAEVSSIQERNIRPLNAFIREVLSKLPHTYTAAGYSTAIATSLDTLCNLLELISGPLQVSMNISLPVMTCALAFYQNTHIKSSAKAELNRTLAKLTERIRSKGQIDHSDFILRRLLVPWLESLPGQVVQLLKNDLLHECSLLLDIMVAAAPVGIINFGVALQDSVLAMIDELKGKSLSSDAQSRFVELLLYIPILEFAELKQIAALLRTGSLNSSSARYLLHLVDQRLVGSSTATDLTVDQEMAQMLLYLRFMLTVALGYTQAALRDLCKSLTPDVVDELPAIGSTVVVPIPPPDNMIAASVQAELTSYVCECLEKTLFSHQLFDLTSDCICNLLCSEDQTFLPVDAAQGILKLALCFTNQVPVPTGSVARGLAHLILTILLNAVAGPPSLMVQCEDVVRSCFQCSLELMTASPLLATSVLEELKDAMLEMRGGKDRAWGRSAVQVLVTLLDEPRLEGALRQCRPLVASSQYSAKLLLHEDASDNTMEEFDGGQCDLLLAKLEMLCRRHLGEL